MKFSSAASDTGADPATAGQTAWGRLYQALFASAEFRYRSKRRRYDESPRNVEVPILWLRYLALAGLSAEAASTAGATPLAPRAPHFTPKAKRVIFLYMQGAPSQHETFDYNPELEAASKSGNVMNSAYKFVQCGQSGLPISELFPNLGKQADELCLLNGMHTDSPAHPQATIELHTGSFNFVRPSMGAWVVYGLGTENQDLPGFITVNPIGLGGAQNFGSAFLPATYQGTPYQTRTGKLPNIANPDVSGDAQRKQIDLIQSLTRDICTSHRRSGAGGRHSVLRDGFQDAELGSGHPRPEGRDRSHQEAVWPGQAGNEGFRNAVPAGPPSGRSGRALHRGVARQLGSSQ